LELDGITLPYIPHNVHVALKCLIMTRVKPYLPYKYPSPLRVYGNFILKIIANSISI